jgi:Fe-S cluster assembly protein SufD
VPEGVHLKEPLRIVHSAAGRLSVTRVVVEIAAGAEATVVETYKDGDEGCLMLAVSELFVRNTARLNHLVVQDLGAGVRGHVTSRAVVRRDAALKTGLIHLGGGHYKADVGAVLDGVGAESVIAGVSMTDRRQHMDLHTVHHHVAERTRSNINYKTAAAGRSESVYTGLIQVDEAAKLSEAFQENRNLMLSDRCRVEAIPELEIRTREVQCTHAATSAPIDDAQLFYLMSRGVDRGEATKMLVRGFFEKALGLAPQGLRQEIEACVDKRLLAMTGRGVR